MEQYIKFLESEEANKQYFIGNPKLKEAVERLIKENKELRENSVPVSLVEEKIEELKKCGNDWIIQREIQVLKELLEKVDD